jgi:hypothetical protein
METGYPWQPGRAHRPRRPPGHGRSPSACHHDADPAPSRAAKDADGRLPAGGRAIDRTRNLGVGDSIEIILEMPVRTTIPTGYPARTGAGS